MNWLHSLRSLFKHQTRTLISLATVTAAMTAIILFIGFSSDVLKSMKLGGVQSQFGHLQLVSSTLQDSDSDHIKNKLIFVDPALLSQISKLPEFSSQSPRLAFQALLTRGDFQFSVKLIGYDPLREPMMFNHVSLSRGTEGFLTGSEKEILLGVSLSKRLQTSVGDYLTIVSQSIDGAINALDIKVRGTFTTGSNEIDNFTAYVPLTLAQQLLQTKKIENVVLRIQDMDRFESIATQIQTLIHEAKAPLLVKNWRELAFFYNQVEDFYNLQNVIVLLILCLLSVLIVMNSMRMTIFERIGEMGTLRALGMTRKQVIFEHLKESLILSFIALLTGFFFGTLAIAALNGAEILVNFPGTSVPVPLKASYEPKAYALSFLCSAGSILIGTFIPAFQASRLTLSAALRKNI